MYLADGIMFKLLHHTTVVFDFISAIIESNASRTSNVLITGRSMILKMPPSTIMAWFTLVISLSGNVVAQNQNPTMRPTLSPTPIGNQACPYNYSLPSNLTLNGLTSPQIDGYINRTGDGIGDTEASWNGTEYNGFLQLNMHTAGEFTKPVMGKAFLGYDCNSKILCVAAYLLAGDTCSVEESDDSWVEFTDGSPIIKLQASSPGANFKYVKYAGGTTGNTIGKLYILICNIDLILLFTPL